MKVYHINSIIKIILGCAIIISSLQFIDPWVDPNSSVLIMGVGLILALWGVGFYVYLLVMSFMSDKKYSYLAKYAYKLSLLTGAFATINRLLVGFAIWSWWIGFLLLVCCGFIGGSILGFFGPAASDTSKDSTPITEE